MLVETKFRHECRNLIYSTYTVHVPTTQTVTTNLIKVSKFKIYSTLHRATPSTRTAFKSPQSHITVIKTTTRAIKQTRIGEAQRQPVVPATPSFMRSDFKNRHTRAPNQNTCTTAMPPWNVNLRTTAMIAEKTQVNSNFLIFFTHPNPSPSNRLHLHPHTLRTAPSSVQTPTLIQRSSTTPSPFVRSFSSHAPLCVFRSPRPLIIFLICVLKACSFCLSVRRCSCFSVVFC